jgi:mycothiol synthase
MPDAPFIRAFEPPDYDRLAAVEAAVDPSTNTTADWLRQRDESRNPRHLHARFVAEHDGLVVGWGQVAHKWWAFHPHKFVMRLNIEPAHQGHGIGSALFSRLLEVLVGWQPESLGTDTHEDRAMALRFLEHRRFKERSRRWESRLMLESAVLDRPAASPSGISVTTYAEEYPNRGERLARALFDLETAAQRAEPDYDPDSAMLFDQFVAYELNPHVFLSDATFLALDGERVVGVSRLARESSHPAVVHVGFTGVHPDYQGRGIAFALKLRTIHYARAHGFREIRTQNDTRNAPMLHINEALGFQRGLAQIIFERTVF